METMQEILNHNIPIKKRRGRPAKVIEPPDLNQHTSTVSDTKEKKMVGKPRASKVLSIGIDGSLTKSSFIASGDKPEIIKPSSTKSKQMKTTNKIGDIRNQEKDIEYKAELQRYLKERLKQGKAGVKLNESIKKLEDKLKALQ